MKNKTVLILVAKNKENEVKEIKDFINVKQVSKTNGTKDFWKIKVLA